MTAPHSEAPWTDEQVESLNGYQVSGVFHPFTCANRDHPSHRDDNPIDRGLLWATNDGWICVDRCGYTQDWAHEWMANGEWRSWKSQR